jgi:hypothetical protein
MFMTQAMKEYEKGNNSIGDYYLGRAYEKASAAYQNAKKFKKIELK